jgi:hypothetical protein
MMCHIVTRRKGTTEPPDEASEAEKKERVIHTRVPESLEAELRKRASDLGISVSNLVRNVIGHAFGLVGDVAADSHAIARAARGETRKPDGGAAASEPAEVIAWQPIVLAKNAVCSQCNDILPRGREAAIAVGGERQIICTKCLEELRQ